MNEITTPQTSIDKRSLFLPYGIAVGGHAVLTHLPGSIKSFAQLIFYAIKQRGDSTSPDKESPYTLSYTKAKVEYFNHIGAITLGILRILPLGGLVAMVANSVKAAAIFMAADQILAAGEKDQAILLLKEVIKINGSTAAMVRIGQIFASHFSNEEYDSYKKASMDMLNMVSPDFSAEKEPYKQAAIQWVTLAAEKGDTQALMTLGDFHRKGIILERNLCKTYEYYEKAANMGDPIAMTGLALMMLKREGLPEEDLDDEIIAWYDTEGKRLLHVAAQKGNSKASYHLGMITLADKAPPKNEEYAKRTAFRHFWNGAMAGCPEACVEAGKMLLAGDAVNEVLFPIDANSPEAQENAKTFFLKAAQQMNAEANFLLFKHNMIEDPQQQFTHVIAAALNGFVEAKHYVGIFYLQGKGYGQDGALIPAGTPEAEKHALQFIQMAAQEGYGPSQVQLGLMQNHPLAKHHWFKKAVVNPNTPADIRGIAQFLLSKDYLNLPKKTYYLLPALGLYYLFGSRFIIPNVHPELLPQHDLRSAGYLALGQQMLQLLPGEEWSPPTGMVLINEAARNGHEPAKELLKNRKYKLMTSLFVKPKYRYTNFTRDDVRDMAREIEDGIIDTAAEWSNMDPDDFRNIAHDVKENILDVVDAWSG